MRVRPSCCKLWPRTELALTLVACCSNSSRHAPARQGRGGDDCGCLVRRAGKAGQHGALLQHRAHGCMHSSTCPACPVCAPCLLLTADQLEDIDAIWCLESQSGLRSPYHCTVRLHALSHTLRPSLCTCSDRCALRHSLNSSGRQRLIRGALHQRKHLAREAQRRHRDVCPPSHVCDGALQHTAAFSTKQMNDLARPQLVSAWRWWAELLALAAGRAGRAAPRARLGPAHSSWAAS